MENMSIFAYSVSMHIWGRKRWGHFTILKTLSAIIPKAKATLQHSLYLWY